MTYQVNYDRLKTLKQANLYLILIAFIIIIVIFLIFTSIYQVDKVINIFGIYSGEVLKIEINNELSDKIKNNNTLIFNGTKTKYEIASFGEFNLVDNEIYQEIYLTIDKKFYANEVGVVEFHYDKQKIFNYILELFK